MKIMTRTNRCGAAIAIMSLVMILGCGSSGEPIAERSGKQGSQSSSDSKALATSDTTPAMDVVSQFLDSVRRGGADTDAISLVTTKARQEFQRTGRILQPIGSPDAKFEVTRSELLPDQPTAAFVHSVWTEPNEEGDVESTEVVWMVQQEEGKWRISGLVLGHATGGQPLLVDFENGNSLRTMFPVPAAGEPAVRQAALPADAGVPVEAAGPSVLQ